uniref:FAS1 domain-containing protein n=1 Tax=Kalanchoe fedtschenkoi TaxID=63787 RepID=A0A7N0T044_KALFE
MLSLTTTLLLLLSASAHNITHILSDLPDYAEYNKLLTQTKVADEVNARQTITVLVLKNSVVNSALKSQPLDAVKALLSIHVLLDYFDSDKLHNLTDGFITATTLYQASGVAQKRNGFVNITDVKGKVFFASATEGSNTTSYYTKPVKSEPFNISVVEISAPIDAPGVLTSATPPDVNLTAAMEKAGSRKFASLVEKLGVAKDFDALKAKGLTVFAPRDDAWQAKGLPDWAKVKEEDLRTVLRYHAAPSYYPVATLKGLKEKFITLATSGSGKFEIDPEASGDFVLLKTGVDTARVVSAAVDSAPVTVLLIDSVLLPVELFGNSSAHPPSGSPPSPSPSPAPKSPAPSPKAPTPSPQPVTPTPAPAVKPPTPSALPAPATPSGEVPVPVAAPAPVADAEPKKKSGGSRGSGGVLSALVWALVIGGASSMLLF